MQVQQFPCTISVYNVQADPVNKETPFVAESVRSLIPQLQIGHQRVATDVSLEGETMEVIVIDCPSEHAGVMRRMIKGLTAGTSNVYPPGYSAPKLSDRPHVRSMPIKPMKQRPKTDESNG